MVWELVCGMMFGVAVDFIIGVEGEDKAVEVIKLRKIELQSESVSEGQREGDA